MYAYHFASCIGSPRVLRTCSALERPGTSPRYVSGGGGSSLSSSSDALEQPGSAAAAYQSALESEPDYAHAHWNLALTYLELERYAEAQSHFETYLELSPAQALEVQPYLDELRRLNP